MGWSLRRSSWCGHRWRHTPPSPPVVGSNFSMAYILYAVLVVVVQLATVSTIDPEAGPRNVRIASATSDSLTISWSLPATSSSAASSFEVAAVALRSFLASPVSIEGTAGGQQSSLVLLGLSPATHYNVSVWAVGEDGNTTEKTYLDAWTLLGDLTAPPRPVVEEMFQDGKRLLIVNITPPTEFHGPITKYSIVVMEEDSLVPFDPAKLVGFAEADEKGYPFYHAGDVNPAGRLQFVVGDNLSPDNPLLRDQQKYDILVGVYSELNGESKSVFSSPLAGSKSLTGLDSGGGGGAAGSAEQFSGSDDMSVRLDAEGASDEAVRRRDAILVFVLSVAIGVLGFLLVASFILYFILRRQYSSKRRSDELILKIHDHDNENSYFRANGQLNLEEGADLNGFYNRLCDLYWQIPRPQLHISDVVLGQGTFGPVRVGKVLRNGQEIAAQIQRCGAHFALSDRDRRVLLAELEAMVRVGSHTNVVEFIGGCEEGDALWMATEHPNNPLRGILLSSRQQTDGRISSIPEYRLMEMIISIANGMKHLAYRGVCHGYLSTRSIMVQLPDMTPKISNFSVARYTPLGKRLDYTRWTAPEAMRRRVTHKGDVWSFGVLVWEICTLGGTPYVELKSNEVQARIAKGHRLAQPRGVDASLFQLMLHCWELDSDERPSFEDLVKDLRSVASDDPIRLPQQAKYIYDKFDPLADES